MQMAVCYDLQFGQLVGKYTVRHSYMRSRGMVCEEEQVYMRYCNIEDKKGYKVRPRN
jgi:hypothetical protein